MLELQSEWTHGSKRTHHDESVDLPRDATIRGLRYMPESILELLSSGMAVEEILADYEDLEREDISPP